MKNENATALLERAVRALRDCEVPERPLARALAITRTALTRASDAGEGSERRPAVFSGWRRIAALAGGTVAVLFAALMLVLSTGGHPVLAETARQLREAKGLRIDLTGYQWEEGRSEPTEVLTGQIWLQGGRLFADLPDRKQWVADGAVTEYFPASKRVIVREAGEEESAQLAGMPSVEELVTRLEGLGLARLPQRREMVGGHEYACIVMAPDAAAKDVVMELYVDPQTARLDYIGYRFAGGPHAGKLATWMEYTYDPVIDDRIFQPVYPPDGTVKVQEEERRPQTSELVEQWRSKALASVTEPGGLEVGVFEAWLAPDGVLGLHIYEYNVWPSGSAFPDEVFDESELTKGGFGPQDWGNTNVLLECQPGRPHRERSASWAWVQGQGPSLLEQRLFFQVPELLGADPPRECTLHVWVLRQPASSFQWTRSYRKEKKNFAYVALPLALPEKPSAVPSDEFVAGFAPETDDTRSEAVRFRTWLLERNRGAEAALEFLARQPVQMQQELARTKLRLLKELGRQEDIDRFLLIHIPWRRQHDKLHEGNIRRLIEEFASPEFTPPE